MDYDFRTPLHIAASFGRKEIVEYLLQKGAKNMPDRWGAYPIHDAIRSGHENIIEILDQYPTVIVTNPNVQDNESMQ